MERMMKAREVSEYTQIPLQVVYRKTRAGLFPSYRSGRTLRYKQKEIDETMKGESYAKNDGTRRRSNLAE